MFICSLAGCFRCKVKITGEMMVSFPAGIVRVLTENPNPSTLTFCVKNTTNIINILVNKQLLTEWVMTLVCSIEINIDGLFSGELSTYDIAN